MTPRRQHHYQPTDRESTLDPAGSLSADFAFAGRDPEQFHTCSAFPELRFVFENSQTKLLARLRWQWNHVLQYNTSFSPFSAISFWKRSTILSRRVITAFTSSLVR